MNEPVIPVVTLTHKPSGPVVVDGPVRVLNNEGIEIPIPVGKTPGRFSLCGCGLSQNKPFCDSSHKR